MGLSAATAAAALRVSPVVSRLPGQAQHSHGHADIYRRMTVRHRPVLALVDCTGGRRFEVLTQRASQLQHDKELKHTLAPFKTSFSTIILSVSFPGSSSREK
eukprot:749565-Hanusia_phi.AAC.2